MTGDDRELLIRIDTKLTVVCGEDGRGGVMAEHDERIRSLEDTRTGQQAAGHVVKVLWGALTGLAVWCADHAKWLGGR